MIGGSTGSPPLLLPSPRGEILLEAPPGVPPLPRRGQRAESLLEWFARHRGLDIAARDCRLLQRGEGVLLSIPLPGGETGWKPGGTPSRPEGAPPWLDADLTCLYRCTGDPVPGMAVERAGDHYLGILEEEPGRVRLRRLEEFLERAGARGGYWMARRRGGERRPVHFWGRPMEPGSRVREWGVEYHADPGLGGSFGLFGDQRENRHRILSGRIGPGFSAFPGGIPRPRVLNAFAYTCSFSVCAALAGARATSLDLSRRHLGLGRSNFRANGLDPDQHEFLHGDAGGWLRRLIRRGRRFEMAILDPPTFSRSRESGAFRVESDLPPLVRQALELLVPGGRLLVSTNKASWSVRRFLEAMERAFGGTPVRRSRFVCEPWDYGNGGYLKAWWAERG